MGVGEGTDDDDDDGEEDDDVRRARGKVKKRVRLKERGT